MLRLMRGAGNEPECGFPGEVNAMIGGFLEWVFAA